MLRDHQGAITDYTRAIELNPNFSYAYCGRGLSKIVLNQKNSACFDFSKAGELGDVTAYEWIKKYCQ